MAIARVFLASLFLVVVPQILPAGDWPQILGPQRNGIAEGEKLAASWPTGAPQTVWKQSVGTGLAGVAVAAGTVYVFDRDGDDERLAAVDALTGKPRWKPATWPSSYQDAIAGDDGPRCVPVVHEGKVYAYGAAGTLACINTKDGKIAWSRNLVTDYRADLGYFGAGSTPLIEGKTLIVNVGGQKSQAGVVGLSIETGKELWKSVPDTASYSSPIAVTVDGTRHVLCITRLKLVSLDPSNGKVRFEFPFGKRGPTVNGANPVVVKDHVLATASYGIGATFAKIGKDRIDPQWDGDEILSSQYTTSVLLDGWLYGIDGRQDAGAASLRCFDPVTKKVAWTEENFGMATLILADNKLVCMKTDGTLTLVAATPKAYEELATAKLFNSTCRGLPALSNGLLYVRDTQTLKCFDLRP
jgi:outer membrane protein assembly factor BamB